MNRSLDQPLSDADPRHVDLLEEAVASGLALDSLPGNTAKIRLILDLARQVSSSPETRILDVGAGGLNVPFNIWEPFVPYADVVVLSGVDVAHLDATASRAAELGFPVDLRPGGADSILATFGRNTFDAVVSTQVLEHLPDWRGGVEAMTDALRPGGMLYITCDSGDLALPTRTKIRLTGKRAYARLAAGVPAVQRAAATALSGDWEKAPTLQELREHAQQLGLEVELIRHYGIQALKAASGALDVPSRLLWLALEEQLVLDDPRSYTLLYLRARRPSA